MSLYSKKLHIRKNGIVTNISLYTSPSDFNSAFGQYPYLKIRDGVNIVYAGVEIPAGPGSNESALRIRRNGTVYAVLRSNVISH